MTETAPHIMELKGEGILSSCEPVIYRSQLHRYIQMPGSGTLLWVKNPAITEVSNRTAIVLSGISDETVSHMIPGYHKASQKGPHIGKFGVYLHKSPRELLQELNGKCITKKIPYNGNQKTNTLIGLIQQRFHTVKLEDTNVNLQPKKTSPPGTKTPSYSRARLFIHRMVEQAELLKSIFLSQVFGNNQKILLMVKIKKGCDTEISVVTDTHMIDNFYMLPEYKFFFADQGRTLSEFLPERVGLKQITI